MNEASIPLPTAGTRPEPIPLAAALPVWTKIALLSFGGPAGQIALMHRVLVEERRWIGERRFLHALNFCMLLPGPEAQQLATYVGWLMHGVRGGLLAGGLFVLPGLVAIMALSIVYAQWGSVGIVASAFFGLKAAVVAIVLEAVWRVGRRAIQNAALLAVAASAFLAIFAFDVPFPVIVLAAGLLGYVGGRFGVSAFRGGGHGESSVQGETPTLLGEDLPAHALPDRRRLLRIAAIGCALWLGPILLLLLALGPQDVFATIAVFFAKLALATFGGAYAVLAYVAQEAVDTYGWLTPAEMLDGLGMAETTPGPLIMVTQFVGFMAAFRAPDGLPPLLAGAFGGLLTTWVTFVPCFVWIFLGAPYAERLREDRALSAALATITAAVVGVILNLAIWFGLHVVFADVRVWTSGPLSLDLPMPASVRPVVLGLAIAALVGLRLRLGTPVVIAAAAAAGIVLGWATENLV